MARKVALSVFTAANYCSVTDYDDVTLEFNMNVQCGMGEFSIELMDAAGSRMGLTHQPTSSRIEFTFDEIALCEINGVATGATSLLSVRDALAPYFFSVGRGYAFYKEITITSAMLLADLAIASLPSNGGGIEIFPAVANTYYDWKIDHEFYFGTVAYNVASQPGFHSQVAGSSSFATLASLPISALNSVANVVVAGIVPQMNVSSVMPIYVPGERVIYKLANNLAQATGDGYVKLKIWYNIRTFG